MVKAVSVHLVHGQVLLLSQDLVGGLNLHIDDKVYCSLLIVWYRV